MSVGSISSPNGEHSGECDTWWLAWELCRNISSIAFGVRCPDVTAGTKGIGVYNKGGSMYRILIAGLQIECESFPALRELIEHFAPVLAAYDVRRAIPRRVHGPRHNPKPPAVDR